ncbi:MAG TPA: ATP-binding protein [Stenomitos sp.]
MVSRNIPQRFYSLRTKLTAILIGFLVLTLGTLGVFLNAFNTRTLSEQMREREALYAANIQQSINQVMFAGKYQVQAYLETLQERDPHLRYVIVIDQTTHEAIAHSDPGKVGTRYDDPVTRQGLASLRSGHPVAQTYRLPSGEPVHDLSLPYVRGFLKEPAGIIRIGTSAAEEQAIIRTSRLYTFAIILVYLVLGALLSVGLGFRLTQGLNRLMTAVRRFGAGDYGAHVPVPDRPRDELDQVGIAFNQMANRLQAYAENLEQQVHERTQQLARLYETLQESEQFLRSVVTNTPIVLFATDRTGRYTLSEGKGLAVLGEVPGERVGKTPQELFPDAPVIAVNIQRALKGEMFRTTVVLRGLWFESWYAPLKDPSGQVTGVIGVAMDVTERQHLEDQLRGQFEKLRELDQLKTNFVNAVTHEIRTPLTSIMGYAEFLEDELGGPLSEQQLEFVIQLERGAKRLEYLVNDLLDFARLEAGTFRLKLEEGDLSSKIRETVDSLKPQLEDGQLHLEEQLPEEPLIITMDAQRIGQVLTNLIGNAIKFTPRGGTIWVRAQVEHGEVRCEIEDTGEGIASEDIPKLFQRFTQLEAGVRKGKGTGLGLSISKAIIEAHGGRIGVTSELGNGATFWFTLPMKPDDPEA